MPASQSKITYREGGAKSHNIRNNIHFNSCIPLYQPVLLN
jgi:hypothetical protein